VKHTVRYVPVVEDIARLINNEILDKQRKGNSHIILHFYRIVSSIGCFQVQYLILIIINGRRLR
jgi:hypothetical protein